MRVTAALAATTAVTLAVTGILVAADDGPETVFPPATRRSTMVQAAGDVGLASFDACETMTDELIARASERGTANPWNWGWGMEGDVMVVELAGDMDGTTGAGEQFAPQASRAVGGAEGFSETNVQIAGVDEPDVVETDGRRLFTVHNGRLHVIDVTQGAPQHLGSVEVPMPGEAQLLLHGDRLLVVGSQWGGGMRGAAEERLMPDMGAATTAFALYDVSSDTPALLAESQVDGSLVSARGIDGTVHAVVAHRPNPIAPMDMGVFVGPDGAFDQERAAAELRTELASTTATDWLPRLTTVNELGIMEQRAAVSCTDVRATSESPDTSMLTVMTFDVTGADLEPEGSSAVLTDAQSITASAEQLVVATPIMLVPGQPGADTGTATGVGETLIESEPAEAPMFSTRLHLFDLAPGGATYVASGEVPGSVLNQFSMDLWDGFLRVATTTNEWSSGHSESEVNVLQRNGDRLVTVGSVGGLGQTERIYSVRFVGDRGYVVTFREVDPLYTLDLSDPANPSVQGELKITGYSAYLHPLAEHRIIGVGQEATTDGRRVGAQVSLFDTSDPANPQRLSQVVLPQSDTEAEWDHHAILVHGDTMAMPYMRWTDNDGAEAGAMVLDVAHDRIGLRGTVEPEVGPAGNVDPWMAQVRRIVYVDGVLYMVGQGTVSGVDATTLGQLGWVAF